LRSHAFGPTNLDLVVDFNAAMNSFSSASVKNPTDFVLELFCSSGRLEKPLGEVSFQSRADEEVCDERIRVA
jgi:hypothetical protein